MRRYYFQHIKEDEDGFGLGVAVAILLIIVGAYWGILHLLDWLTMDTIPWWLELLSSIPAFFLFFAILAFGKNPLHWWPMFCGTKVEIPSHMWMHMNISPDRFLKPFGGPLNVHYANSEVLIFRKNKDAVFFCLKYL